MLIILESGRQKTVTLCIAMAETECVGEIRYLKLDRRALRGGDGVIRQLLFSHPEKEETR